MNATTRGTPTYYLGTINGGRTFIFTDLPAFRSGMEAVTYANSRPMNGPVYVFEERQLWRHGVNFGMTSEIVATAIR